MQSLRGIVLGDSQVKFLTRSRLRLSPCVDTCTFSFGGHDAMQLSQAVARLRFNRMDFAVLYIGGNDLSHLNADPQAICNNIKKLVLQVQEVAPVVLTFKVLPRCYGGGDQHAVRNAVQRRFSLNKKLTSMLKRMPGVRILNPDHLFLDQHKKPKRHLFAADGYHVSRCQGINNMARMIAKGLQSEYGRKMAAGNNNHQELYKVYQCSTCHAKGHTTGACKQFCSPHPHGL